MAARAHEERLNSEYQLGRRQKETKILRKELAKEITDHQVSKIGFNPTQSTLFHFHPNFLMERESLCYAFTFMHKIFRWLPILKK
jgi:hypothetical protein